MRAPVRSRLYAVVLFMAAGLTATPATASDAAGSLCRELGGGWDGLFCSTTVHSPRRAVREIRMAIPGDLVVHPVVGPPVRDYLTNLFTNWREKAQGMVQDSYGNENFEIFQHGPALSIVFHEDYHAFGPYINNAYRTFTFDMEHGRQLELSDIVNPGVDPLAEIPQLGAPYITSALDSAFWEHRPGDYPFTPDRWTPDQPFSGGYRAWALTPDELLLFLPDYPVGHDTPIKYDYWQQWYMDGGNAKPRIPLTALAPILRPEYGGV